MILSRRELYRVLQILFRDPKVGGDHREESMPAATADLHDNPIPVPGSTTVVFDDHRFCAGRRLDVGVMAAPHRHSQFEVNHILTGAMTYWIDGREVVLETGTTALFWGMVPHRSIAHEPGTTFICLYMPAAMFMTMQVGEALRSALFAGDLVEAVRRYDTDEAMFRRWRSDLLEEDPALEIIVRDEMSARLRRIDRDGWRDLRAVSVPSVGSTGADAASAARVERMARYIGEHAHRPISARDVAAAAGLHPNYAMALFRKATGLTITDSITRNRLDAAQALLVSSDEDIAGVAFAAGFGSLSRFYEAFQRRFDMSPAKFRRWHRGGVEALPQS